MMSAPGSAAIEDDIRQSESDGFAEDAADKCGQSEGAMHLSIDRPCSFLTPRVQGGLDLARWQSVLHNILQMLRPVNCTQAADLTGPFGYGRLLPR